MADHSKIDWTDATWNPVLGCSPTSPGCDHCYAARHATRLAANPATPQYRGLAEGGRWTGQTTFVESALDRPAEWRKPRQIFVCSMGDLFHEHVDFDDIDSVFCAMASAPQHTYLLLTKRAAVMRRYIMERVVDGSGGHFGDWPWSNVWLGVTAEDQARADERIPILLDTPAAVRFVSVEPMLGPVDLRRLEIMGHRRAMTRHLTGATDPMTLEEIECVSELRLSELRRSLGETAKQVTQLLEARR